MENVKKKKVVMLLRTILFCSAQHKYCIIVISKDKNYHVQINHCPGGYVD